MADMVHKTLRKKLGGLRFARPPVSDVAELGEAFARLLEDRFRGVIQMRPHIRVEAAMAQRQGPALAHIAANSLIATTVIDDNFAGCAAFAPNFAFRLIEMMTGVSAPSANTAHLADGEGEGSVRRLTSIDRVLLQYPAAAVFGAFIDAMPSDPPPRVMSAFANPVLSINSSETRDEGVEAAEGAGVDGLAITLSITLSGPDDIFAMPVFVPLTTLDMLDMRRERARETAHTPSAWSRTMLAAAKGAECRMVGVLHEKKMSIGDIRDMKVGSVIPLPQDHHMQIDLRIDAPGGVTHGPSVGGGKLGALDGQRAVRLTAPPDEAFLSHLEVLED